MGDNTKKVTLVEYGDYQCPACGAYYPIVKQITDKYSKDIQFQFRNFPLSQIHQNARAGARAAEAAAKQNKYWEMHDLLYEQQKSWESSTNVAAIFETYATQLGLNMTKYKADFGSNEVNDIINADYAEGVRLGVDSTPSFFLQGKKIENPQSLDAFSKLIDDAIKKASN
jgi:protein-disulfide isomerase